MSRKRNREAIRTKLIRKIVCYLTSHPQEIYKRIQLQILLWVTARAFRKKSKWILFRKDPLSDYARFSWECMAANPTTTGASKYLDRFLKPCRNSRNTLRNSLPEEDRLYQISYRLGENLRKITGFICQEDLQRLVFFLYRYIGISMIGSLPGQIHVEQCFFAKEYEPEQCKRISAMDSGIIAGIFGGGKLTFTARITEGCGQCLACFEKTNVVKEAQGR